MTMWSSSSAMDKQHVFAYFFLIYSILIFFFFFFFIFFVKPFLAFCSNSFLNFCSIFFSPPALFFILTLFFVLVLLLLSAKRRFIPFVCHQLPMPIYASLVGREATGNTILTCSTIKTRKRLFDVTKVRGMGAQFC